MVLPILYPIPIGATRVLALGNAAEIKVVENSKNAQIVTSLLVRKYRLIIKILFFGESPTHTQTHTLNLYSFIGFYQSIASLVLTNGQHLHSGALIPCKKYILCQVPFKYDQE